MTSPTKPALAGVPLPPPPPPPLGVLAVDTWTDPRSVGPFGGRDRPRWSVVGARLVSPAPRTGLPGMGSMVGVRPPLFCSGPRWGSALLMMTPGAVVPLLLITRLWLPLTVAVLMLMPMSATKLRSLLLMLSAKMLLLSTSE